MFKKIVSLLLILALARSAIIQTNTASGGVQGVLPTISSATIDSSPNAGFVNEVSSSQIISPLIFTEPTINSNQTLINTNTGTVGGQTQLTPLQIKNLMNDAFFTKVYNAIQQYFEQTYNVKIQRVLSLYAQMVSGTNYRLICTTKLGIAQIKVFAQPWTNTITILSASITSATGAKTK